MLTDKFKQRYRPKRGPSSAKLLLVTSISFCLLLVLVFYMFNFVPLSPNRLYSKFSITETLNFTELKQQLLPAPPKYKILKQQAMTSTQTTDLYIETECTVNKKEMEYLSDVLTKSRIKHNINITKQESQACHGILLGPFNDYAKLSRAKHILNQMHQKNTIMTRR